MTTYETDVPNLLPVLSRGKHRNPRKGGCFMELASFLAGERWSDHPACTQRLLAALARHVNDYTSDEGRSRLAVLVPSVIGLTSDDPVVDARIALRAATHALPVVAAERQCVMAVSVLAAEQVISELTGRPADVMDESSRAVLAEVPHAAQWARRFTRRLRRSPKAFRRYAAPVIVHSAVEGIARACVADPDPLLFDLLENAIADCRALIHPEPDAPVAVDEERWQTACLTLRHRSL